MCINLKRWTPAIAVIADENLYAGNIEDQKHFGQKIFGFYTRLIAFAACCPDFSCLQSYDNKLVYSFPVIFTQIIEYNFITKGVMPSQ